MSKLDWVKWEAGKFLGGVIGMSIEEIGVYSVVLNLIYDNGGPIKDDRDRIARRCAMRPTSFEKVFQSLLEAGKLVAQNGLIMNEKAVDVLESRSKVVEKWKKNLQSAKSKVEEIFKDINDETYASADTGAQVKRAVESESVDKKERKKDSSSSRRAKTANGVEYSEEFELKVWGPYPRKKGTSKKVAYQFWNMLNEINQQRVISAIPIFADQMKREGRTDDKIKHLERFISQGVYETMAVTPAEAKGSNVIKIPWFKTATREQWERALRRYSNDSNWGREWGPEPGFAGCAAPQDLIDKLPFHLHPDNDIRLKGKRSVDTPQPAVP